MAPIQRVLLPPTLSLSSYTKTLTKQQERIQSEILQLLQSIGANSTLQLFQQKGATAKQMQEHVALLQAQHQRLQDVHDCIRRQLRRNCQYIETVNFEELTRVEQPVDTTLQKNVLEMKNRLHEKVKELEAIVAKINEKNERHQKDLESESEILEREKRELEEEERRQKALIAEVEAQQAETPQDVPQIPLLDAKQFQKDATTKIDTSIKEADVVTDRIRKTIKVVGEKRHREESILMSPPAVKKMRRSHAAGDEE